MHSNHDYDKIYTTLKYYLLGREYYDAVDALQFARELHNGMRKDQVTPEFQHQLEISLYITTLKDLTRDEEQTCVVCALLHDTMEDYSVERDTIGNKYGTTVAENVWALTKKYKGVIKGKEQQMQELVNNPYGAIVKGADRIHNVNSMFGVFTQQKQTSYLEEVTRYFLPMIRNAKRKHPKLSSAFSNIEHVLRSQYHIVTSMREDTA